MTTTYGEMRTETEKVVDAEILARVKNGIRWLEENVGPDWVDKIDPSKLMLERGDSCILGQVFKDECDEYSDGYEYATDLFPELEGFGVDQGFCVHGSGYETKIRPEDSWVKLQEAWESVLIPLVSVVD